MMFRNAQPFLKWLVAPLLVASAFAQAPKGKVPSGPLPAELYTVKAEPFEQTIATVGTLRANESVTLVSELSRRLMKIEVKEGSDVAAGDLLFKLDDSDLLAELGEIDARLKLAMTNKQRVDNLLPRKAISQQEFDSSTAELSVLQAQRNTQAVLISKTAILAPFSGRVGVRQVSEGAFVSSTTPLVTLQDVSRIKVDFPLPERYSSEVKQGQKFTFSVAGNGQVFDGVVTVIEPAIEATTRSLLVRGVCDTPKGLLPGGFAEVTLTLDGKTNGFLVPSQAIVPSQRGQGVYVISDGKAKLVSVEIGVRTEDKVQVLRGLNEGDLVATTNLLRMRPGLEVTAAKP
ncbi:MAG: efflux RND transporter periplasmic adaptor subunit [Luteolibacter sp.]|uniref:efflux RND transporter periplasmic adaptor subunit n=1 Tax=Luteolibacter sp. TaxID=1962973 RepID=UPI003264136E